MTTTPTNTSSPCQLNAFSLSSTPSCTTLATQTRTNNTKHPINSELLKLIFSFCRPEISECANVNRQWKQLAYNFHVKFQGEMCLKGRCVTHQNPVNPRIPLNFYKEPAWNLVLISNLNKRKVVLTLNLKELSPKELENIKGVFCRPSLSSYCLTSCPQQQTYWVAYNPRLIKLGDAPTEHRPSPSNIKELNVLDALQIRSPLHKKLWDTSSSEQPQVKRIKQ